MVDCWKCKAMDYPCPECLKRVFGEKKSEKVKDQKESLADD